MKQYKAGQIVTIDGKRYRLKKDIFDCFVCPYRDSDNGPCVWCMLNIPENLNLTPISV